MNQHSSDLEHDNTKEPSDDEQDREHVHGNSVGASGTQHSTMAKISHNPCVAISIFGGIAKSIGWMP